MSGGPRPSVSLVIAAYAMQRELPRTLRSLSTAYQRDPPAARWELIVIDNGSPEPLAEPKGWADPAVTLRLVRLEGEASLAAALNHGLGLAQGELVGVWIDGARMASPGLLGACARAAALHPRPVIATRNYHLGHGLQHSEGMRGYDQQAEDALLASIGWPDGAERLVEISTPEQADPGGALIETNALFMTRALWGELGGFDTRFAGPGGGAVNADMFLRACAAPGTQLIRILGEGTFHQFHGGVTTGAGQERAAWLLKMGSKQYFRLRGRPLRAVRDLGWLYDSRRGLVHPPAMQEAADDRAG
ncbi:glycosyltransferase family 2 protein [Sediminicoccus rosea]|uniref:Glycosyltransferase n=1 Tax=Sediminicoccus rosea TaxID=1225128 RepID=A0ABZ0PME1_9PROT|nr:glycosyltransferase [Sediminicoccus rosea]WPB86908.1 glycosyltransferase [Sediminicoccus rosea]